MNIRYRRIFLTFSVIIPVIVSAFIYWYVASGEILRKIEREYITYAGGDISIKEMKIIASDAIELKNINISNEQEQVITIDSLNIAGSIFDKNIAKLAVSDFIVQGNKNCYAYISSIINKKSKKTTGKGQKEKNQKTLIELKNGILKFSHFDFIINSIVYEKNEFNLLGKINDSEITISYNKEENAHLLEIDSTGKISVLNVLKVVESFGVCVPVVIKEKLPIHYVSKFNVKINTEKKSTAFFEWETGKLDLEILKQDNDFVCAIKDFHDKRIDLNIVSSTVEFTPISNEYDKISNLKFTVTKKNRNLVILCEGVLRKKPLLIKFEKLKKEEIITWVCGEFPIALYKKNKHLPAFLDLSNTVITVDSKKLTSKAKINIKSDEEFLSLNFNFFLKNLSGEGDINLSSKKCNLKGDIKFTPLTSSFSFVGENNKIGKSLDLIVDEIVLNDVAKRLVATTIKVDWSKKGLLIFLQKINKNDPEERFDLDYSTETGIYNLIAFKVPAIWNQYFVPDSMTLKSGVVDKAIVSFTNKKLISVKGHFSNVFAKYDDYFLENVTSDIIVLPIPVKDTKDNHSVSLNLENEALHVFWKGNKKDSDLHCETKKVKSLKKYIKNMRDWSSLSGELDVNLFIEKDNMGLRGKISKSNVNNFKIGNIIKDFSCDFMGNYNVGNALDLDIEGQIAKGKIITANGEIDLNTLTPSIVCEASKKKEKLVFHYFQMRETDDKGGIVEEGISSTLTGDIDLENANGELDLVVDKLKIPWIKTNIPKINLPNSVSITGKVSAILKLILKNGKLESVKGKILSLGNKLELLKGKIKINGIRGLLDMESKAPVIQEKEKHETKE